MADQEAQDENGDAVDLEQLMTDWSQLHATALERTSQATRDFCIFMQSLFVPEEEVCLAPEEGGWPGIDKDSFSRLDKTDTAIEMLKHMSYIRDQGLSSFHEIMPEVTLADYRDPNLIKKVKEAANIDLVKMGLELFNPLPPYVVSLVGGDVYEQRIQLVLDCRYGVFYWVGRSPEDANTLRMHPDETDETEESDESEFWSDAAWPVEEFFGMIKDKFTSLEQLPRNRKEVSSVHNDEAGIFTDLKAIYQEYGWPQEYRKEECMKALVDLAQNRKQKS